MTERLRQFEGRSRSREAETTCGETMAPQVVSAACESPHSSLRYRSRPSMTALLLATGLALLFAAREASAGSTPGTGPVLFLGALALGIAIVVATRWGVAGGSDALLRSALGVVCTAGPVLALALRKHVARGDVALFAVVGALLGPCGGLHALTMGLGLAAAYALLRVTLRGDLAGLVRVLLGRPHKNLSAAVRSHLIAHESVTLGAPTAVALLVMLAYATN